MLKQAEKVAKNQRTEVCEPDLDLLSHRDHHRPPYETQQDCERDRTRLRRTLLCSVWPTWTLVYSSVFEGWIWNKLLLGLDNIWTQFQVKDGGTDWQRRWIGSLISRWYTQKHLALKTSHNWHQKQQSASCCSKLCESWPFLFYLPEKQTKVKMWPKADMALCLLTPIRPRLDKVKTKNSDVTRVQCGYVPFKDTVQLTEILELHSCLLHSVFTFICSFWKFVCADKRLKGWPYEHALWQQWQKHSGCWPHLLRIEGRGLLWGKETFQIKQMTMSLDAVCTTGCCTLYSCSSPLTASSSVRSQRRRRGLALLYAVPMTNQPLFWNSLQTARPRRPDAPVTRTLGARTTGSSWRKKFFVSTTTTRTFTSCYNFLWLYF